MKLLVTGGAGFIGSHYVRTALSGGYDGLREAEIVVLDKLTYAGSLANLEPVWDDPRLTFVEGDICDTGLVNDLLSDIDQIVHFAAESHVDRSIESAGSFVRTNVRGTQTLLDASLRSGIDAFVHISTDEVYGSIHEGSWTEGSPLEPNSPYAASKAAADLIVRAYFITHGVPVNITRGSNTYGPYQHPEKLIPLAITKLLQGERVPVYGDGKNVREWLHVDDHCRAVESVRARGQRGTVYNVGGGRELKNVDVVGDILALMGRGWDDVEFVTDRKGHDRRYSLNASRIQSHLGFRPSIDFRAGLEGTVEFYLGRGRPSAGN